MDDQTDLSLNKWQITVVAFPSCEAEVFCFRTKEEAERWAAQNIDWLNSQRHSSWYGPRLSADNT